MNWFKKLWHLKLKQPFRLSYRVVGNGPQDVILLHGIASDRSFWQPLISLLESNKYRIIAPDLLGHGQSPRPGWASYSTDDQALALRRILKKLRVKRAIIVGHSMGSLVATRLAYNNQDFCSHLILYEPPLFSRIPEFSSKRRRRNFYYHLYDRIAANPKGRYTITKLISRLAKNWQSYLVSDQAWVPLGRSLRNNIMDAGRLEELKGIAIETDIVHGRLDVVVPTRGLKKNLQANQNIRFHKTTEGHKLTDKSAKFLASLITANKEAVASRPVAEVANQLD